jgi:hypothetical protein
MTAKAKRKRKYYPHVNYIHVSTYITPEQNASVSRMADEKSVKHSIRVTRADVIRQAVSELVERWDAEHKASK